MNQQPHRVIYAFPHAGASSGIYASWLRQLQNDPEIRFMPVNIPGRGKFSRENGIESLNLLVERLAEDIANDFKLQSAKGIRNWATFGHSFGGVLSAFVTEKLLTQHKMSPDFSIISASVAPSVQPEDTRHQWPDEKILEKVRSDNGTPESILNEPAFARRLVTQLRTDYILRHQFLNRCDLKVPQPLILIAADKDVDVPHHMLQAWQNHTLAQCKHIMIEGDHFAIYQHLDLVRSLLVRKSVYPQVYEV
ncbi:thioesterase II family protein [Pantoea agglomerans]|uniref:thioesterase II family protein n=1 Tax=Enterobacter agglomerans TaxID=549 RepID=UPI003208F9B1